MSLYLVESSNTETQTILHEFHRTKEGKKVIKKITTAKPYFFVDEDAPIDKWEQVIKVVRGFTSIEKKPVKQVFVNRIRDVKSMRKGIATMGFESYEADIYFHNRYTNDLPSIEKTTLFQCFLDIETDSDDKFPDIDTANHAVTCLTVKMNGVMKTWLFGEHITPDILSQLKHTVHFKREDDMLEDFVKWLKAEQPDIITAWNCINKDTFLITNNGLSTISDIATGDKLYADNKVIKKEYTEKKAVEFGSRFGIIRASSEHKFMVVDTPFKYKSLIGLQKSEGEFLPIKNITKGFLKTKYDINSNKDVNINNEILYLLGLIYSDGCIQKWRTQVYNNSKKIINRLKKLKETYFNHVNKIYVDKRHTPNTYNIVFKTSYLKPYLEYIFNGERKELNINKLSKLSPKQFGIFISGLIDGDGSYNMIQVNEKTSYKEVNGFHSLLLYNGIIATIQKYGDNFNNRFHICSIENKILLNALHKNTILKYKIRAISNSKKRNRTTNIPKYFIDREHKIIYSYITRNKPLSIYEEMCDIETNNHTFMAPMLTHNCHNFDLRYLINRFERLNVEYRHISPLNQVYIKEMYRTNTHYVKIKGVVVFDQLEAYKLWRKYGNMPVLASYSLDFVAKTVLGEQKLDHGKTMHWLWKNDVKTLIEYNQWDVELLVMIEDRCKIVDFFDELRRKCRIQFDDVYKTTAMIDGFLLNRLQKKIILPNSRYGTGEKFKGAYVLDPVKGLYDNIMCLDIKAFYPNMIKTFNISYETVNGEIKLPIGASFRRETGIVPMLLDELAIERQGYKDKMDAAKTNAEEELWHQRQYGTKVLANSFFGYLGFPGARLYRPEVASSITGMGEYIIKEIIKWLAEIDYEVIYGDTDSVYVKAKYTAPLSVLQEGFNLTDYINKKLEEFSLNITTMNTLEIEFEKAMKKMLFTEAKKKYAYKLLWKDKKNFDVDDKMELTGFGAKRSDSNKVSKIVQREVLERVLNGDSKKDVLEYVKGMKKKMIDREFSDEDIGFPKGIKKSLSDYKPPGPIIKGAVFSNMHYNTNFEEGSKPKFVWIKGIKGIGKPIVVLNNKEYILESMTYQTKIPDGVEIDWKRMTESTFKKKLENIFDSAGWGWTDLNVRPLSDFF